MLEATDTVALVDAPRRTARCQLALPPAFGALLARYQAAEAELLEAARQLLPRGASLTLPAGLVGDGSGAASAEPATIAGVVPAGEPLRNVSVLVRLEASGTVYELPLAEILNLALEAWV